jgi:hypothetical protein
MRLPLVLGAALAAALGCSTPTPPAPATLRTEASAPSTAVDGEWADGKSDETGSAAETAAEPDRKPPDYRTFRLGFWEFDLMALDLEPRGTTFRLLDLRIFRLLEVGSGPDYHSFALGEIPPLVTLFSTRHEEETGEFKIVDVEALALALVRHTRDSESEFQTHFLKLPVLGSTFAREQEDGLEKQHILYVFRREVED